MRRGSSKLNPLRWLLVFARPATSLAAALRRFSLAARRFVLSVASILAARSALLLASHAGFRIFPAAGHIFHALAARSHVLRLAVSMPHTHRLPVFCRGRLLAARAFRLILRARRGCRSCGLGCSLRKRCHRHSQNECKYLVLHKWNLLRMISTRVRTRRMNLYFFGNAAVEER